MSAFHLLALLLAGHAVADYPLQGEFLARAKNRFAALPGVPWYQALGAHATIHGGIVLAITGNLTLGLAETLVHFVIDDAKCAGRLTYNQDQFLHIACKVLWVLVIYSEIAQ